MLAKLPFSISDYPVKRPHRPVQQARDTFDHLGEHLISGNPCQPNVESHDAVPSRSALTNGARVLIEDLTQLCEVALGPSSGRRPRNVSLYQPPSFRQIRSHPARERICDPMRAPKSRIEVTDKRATPGTNLEHPEDRQPIDHLADRGPSRIEASHELMLRGNASASGHSALAYLEQKGPCQILGELRSRVGHRFDVNKYTDV